MTYQTLMVHLDLACPSNSALRIACELADRWKSDVIGLAAGLPDTSLRAGGIIAPSILEYDEQRLRHGLDDCERRFRTAMKPLDATVTWRSAITEPERFLVNEARATDLLIVGRAELSSTGLLAQPLNIGDAAMRCGRPILIVPSGLACLAAERCLVAWKDTAESRHAIAAALPLLRQAKEVIIVEIIQDEVERIGSKTRLADVVKWLLRHNVSATASTELSAGDTGGHLDLIATENRIDVIVAGAYGHSRLHEWVFGGVTRYLLQHASACTLLTH